MKVNMKKSIYIHDGFIFEPKDLCPYCWKFEDWKKTIDWLSFLGINIIEFATQVEFLRIPTTEFEKEKIKRMQKVIDYVHQKKMQIYSIVFTNTMSTVPKNENPKGYFQGRHVNVCPQINDNFKKTIEINEYFIEQYKDADGFEIFAGDWGGCRCGKCSYHTYLDYVKEYYRIIRKINKEADIYINLWCISYWSKEGKIPHCYREIFDAEIKYSEKIIEALGSLPSDIHITFPCHHLYRPLCWEHYKKEECPEWPDKKIIDKIHQMGRKVLAWPHFIMDDDPHRPVSFGKMHSEVRYLKQLIKKISQLKFDGIMGNLYVPKLQLLNTYAFSRLCDNHTIEAREIFEKFSDLIVEEKDKEKLTDLLVMLENNSGWEKQMPKGKRLLPLDISFPFSEALRKAENIQPIRPYREELLDTPRNFLANLAVCFGEYIGK